MEQLNENNNETRVEYVRRKVKLWKKENKDKVADYNRKVHINRKIKMQFLRILLDD